MRRHSNTHRGSQRSHRSHKTAMGIQKESAKTPIKHRSFISYLLLFIQTVTMMRLGIAILRFFLTRFLQLLLLTGFISSQAAPRIQFDSSSNRKDSQENRRKDSFKERLSQIMSMVNTGKTSCYKTVTLKARVEDLEAMECAIFNLTENIGHLVVEEDIYFKVLHGQMKLRICGDPGKDHGELISYTQTNNSGPNFSESRVTQVSGVQRLRETLAFSLTELGVISKKRRIYANDNVRVNLDQVEGLGSFVDIDITSVNAMEDQKLLERAMEIQRKLGIHSCQLVPFSYLELYRSSLNVDSGIDDSESVNSDVR